MSEQRKAKQFLSGEQKYNLWVRFLTEQITASQASAEAGVDRSTISNLRKTAREGAITALTDAKPGRRRSAKDATESARLQAEIDRLGHVVIEQAVDLAVCGEKRVGVERAGPSSRRSTRQGRPARHRCRRARGGLDSWPGQRVLELDRGRLWRWQQRAAAGSLADQAPGGNPIHGLLDWEEQAILGLYNYNTWGPVDLSHRKLAHRGSYLGQLWVSPSRVDRVLDRNGLSLKGDPRPARSHKTPPLRIRRPSLAGRC